MKQNQPYPWRFIALLTLAMAVPRVYSTINSFWVGRISMEAPAISEQYEFIALMLEIIHETISVGVLALVARTFFTGETDRSIGIWKAGLISSVILSGTVTAVVIVATETFSAAIGTPQEVLEDTMVFLRIKALAIPVESSVLVTLMALKSLRKGRLVFLLSLLSVGCNILFDLFLLSDADFSMQLGLVGSAIGFLGTQSIMLLMSMYAFLKTSEINVIDLAKAPYRDHLIPLFSIGGWSGIESLTRNLGYMGVLVMLNTMGTEEYGGYGIAMNLIWTAIIPVLAIAEGTNVMVGNLTGKGDAEGVTQTVITSSSIAVIYMVALIGGGFWGWNFLAGLLTINPQMVYFSRSTFLWLSVPYLLMAISLQIKSLFYGTGRTRPLFFMSLIVNGAWTLPFCLAVKTGILDMSFTGVMIYFTVAFVLDIILTLHSGRKVLATLE